MTDSTSTPEKTANNQPQCPTGEDDCHIIDELVDLRQALAELSELVRTDPLTGLANYRYFSQALEQEIERTQRSGQPTTLIMLDIDFFKKVNDQWGHEIGNQALIHLAKLMLQTVRKLDIPCRYGGEEFTMVLPDTTLEGGWRVAENMRQAVLDKAIPHEKSKAADCVTLSLGVASYFGQIDTPEQLLKQADDALYQAKQKGRNRVELA